jgi:hypothetical protein
MLNPVVLFPAYGKRYTSEQAMREAWDKGTDFRVMQGPGNGQYASKRNMVELAYLASSIVILDPYTKISFTIA